MKDKTAWLRSELPAVAGLVDGFATAFGRENIRVTYAKENGHEIGAPAQYSPERVVSMVDIQIGPLRAPAAQQNASGRKR